MLRRVGEALYGDRWQSALGAGLRVSDRTVRYWLSGSPIPGGVRGELRDLLGKRYKVIAALLRVLTI